MLPPPSHAISTPTYGNFFSSLSSFSPSPTFPPPHLHHSSAAISLQLPLPFFLIIVSLSHFPPFLLSTTPFPRPSSSSLFLFSVFSVLLPKTAPCAAVLSQTSHHHAPWPWAITVRKPPSTAAEPHHPSASRSPAVLAKSETTSAKTHFFRVPS